MRLRAVGPGPKALLEAYLRHWCRGRKRAMTQDALGQRLELTAREIREIAKELRREHKPVGSTTGEPAGMYWITDLREARAVRDSLRSRAIDLLVTVAALEGSFPELQQPALPI